MTEEIWNVKRRYVIRRFPIPEDSRNNRYLELVDDDDRILLLSPYVSVRIIGCQATETELIIVIEQIEKRDRIE